MSFFGGGGGDNSMMVTIGGNAMPLAAATAMAADALGSLGPAAQEAAGQANAALGSIGAAAQETMLGPTGMATTTQIATESMGRSLGSGPSGMLTMFGQAGQSVMGFGDKILGAINPLNIFHSQVLRLVEVMGLWRLFDGGLQSVTAFVNGIWQLPIAMEKAQGSWQYMFNPAIQPGQSMSAWMQQGKGIGQQISDWTMKASISLPYTRQDLISAITSLAPAGLSSTGIEHYLPVIGDIAAAMNPNLSLQQASYSVMGAMMGYSRMLRYDLHINPEQLTQYGYDASNNATLLPALEKFSQARGMTSYNAQGQDVGAAFNISHTTFWGEWSSLIDRIQNSQIMTGDYGPFQSLKKGLEWVNNFIDTHSSDIEKFSHLIGDTLSGGMKSVANAGTALFQGISSTGAITDFVDAFSGLDKWFTDPAMQKGLDSFLQLAGKNISISLQGFGQGIGSVATGIGSVWTNMGPSGQKGLENALTIPGMLASVLGQGAGGALSSLPYAANLIGGGLAEPFHLGGDIATGQFGRLGPDFYSFLSSSMTDIGQFWGHSVEPAGGIYDTIMNWAGHPTHGAGKKWVDAQLHNMGGELTGAGDWLHGLFFGPPSRGPGGKPGSAGGFNVLQGVAGPLQQFMPQLQHMTGLLGPARTEWDHFTQSIEQAGQKVLSLLPQMGQTIKNGIDTVVNNAVHWGENFVNNLIQGMRNMIPNLGKTASDLATQIANYLAHRSPAKMGPMSDSDRWGSNFVRMFAADLESGIPRLATVASQMAAALGQGIVNNTNNSHNVTVTNHFYGANPGAAGVHGSVGQASAYAQAVRSPGGYHQFGALGAFGF